MTDIFKRHLQYKDEMARMKEEKKEKAKKMLEYRYSTTPPLSYAKVGKKFGISRQRVEQIVNSFI